MKFLLRVSAFSIAICAFAAFVLALLAAQSVGADRSVLQADHSLIQALRKSDKASLDLLLDPRFIWIDSNGKSLTRAQVLENFPVPANPDLEPQARIYGQSAVVRANRGRLQVLRIWAKRSWGWQAVLYQEVMLAVKSEPVPRRAAAPYQCENPCKSIPFQPETESEREVIASWQRVMQAMADKDANAYAPLIADEFTATDTHHDAVYTKADRIAQISRQKETGGGSIPSPLISASVFDFGETVMLIAREERPGAKPYFNTRMWVRRDGRWQMLFSFNTRIE